MNPELGIIVGFVLTLMVFSYLLGDNVLYRLAIFVFIGLTAGFVTIVTVDSVLIPWLNATLLSGDVSGAIFGSVPLFFGGLLLLKAFPRTTRLANLGIAFIVGIGTAVALVGAVSGTLLPLTLGTMRDLQASTVPAAEPTDALNGFIIVIGVICTLIYFQYLARRIPGTDMTRRSLLTRTLGGVGQGFIAVTLGALYGGAILTGLVVAVERVAFLLSQLPIGR